MGSIKPIKNLMWLHNEQTNNVWCLALHLHVCMHVCFRISQHFKSEISLHSGNGCNSE